jgi:uncharacterized protein (DUF885 family)
MNGERMRSLKWLMVAALALSLAAGCGPRRSQPMTAFDGRLNDWTRQILADSPELATAAGVDEAAAGGAFRSRLDDRSALAVEARRSAAVRRYVELRALNTDALSDSDALTYAVLDAQFAAAAGGAAFEYGDFTPLGGVRPYVLNQLDAAFLTLPAFFDDRHTVANDDDAEAYLARLRAVATAIDAETERARADAERGVRPPRAIIDLTLSLLDETVAQSPMQQVYVTGLQRKLGLSVWRTSRIDRGNPCLQACIQECRLSGKSTGHKAGRRDPYWSIWGSQS